VSAASSALRCGLANRQEALGLERRAADQAAVYVVAAEQAGRVVLLHAAAVLNAHEVGEPPAPAAGDRVADERVDFLGLVVGRIAAGADRPHRLVRDDQPPRVGHLRRFQLIELVLDDRQRLARVAFFEFLADAMHEDQPVLVDRRGLAGDEVAGLLEHVPALAVTGEHELHAQVFQLSGADLAGECAEPFAVRILRAQEHGRVGDRLADGVDVDERRRDADVDRRRRTGCDGLGHGDGRGLVRVHLPGAGDEGGATHAFSTLRSKQNHR
jgi:hypothetical protein